MSQIKSITYSFIAKKNPKLFFSDTASLAVEINGKSRHWLEFNCQSSFNYTNDMTLINLNCTLLGNINTIKIPEESTVPVSYTHLTLPTNREV